MILIKEFDAIDKRCIAAGFIGVIPIGKEVEELMIVDLASHIEKKHKMGNPTFVEKQKTSGAE